MHEMAHLRHIVHTLPTEEALQRVSHHVCSARQALGDVEYFKTYKT
jgi:hypothetical protein